MATRRMAVCIVGAMVGAGFASGREIVSFFTRYGSFSWVLIGIAAAGIVFLMLRVMRSSRAGMEGLFPAGGWAGRTLLTVLLFSTAGGMAAAAGEITALTLPLQRARLLGMAATTAMCYGLSRRPLRALSILGWLLMPILLIGIALCLRSAEQPSSSGGTWPGWAACLSGIGMALGYAGMNVTLAAQVLCEAGSRCSAGRCCRVAAWTGGIIGSLLLLCNAAFLPHMPALENAALPSVQLLRRYGKAGFYLSALMLYLAIVTTQIAVLRALDALLGRTRLRLRGEIICLGTLGMGLCGFEKLVAVAYPFLGMLCWAGICWPVKNEKGKTAPCDLPFQGF